MRDSDCALDGGGSGAGHRRGGRLRMFWRHEQLSLQMMRATMEHHTWQRRPQVCDADTQTVTDAAPAPVVEYIAPAPIVPAAPAPVIKCVAPAPVVECIGPVSVLYTAPAPVIEGVAPTPLIEHIAPAHAVYTAPAIESMARVPVVGHITL